MKAVTSLFDIDSTHLLKVLFEYESDKLRFTLKTEKFIKNSCGRIPHH